MSKTQDEKKRSRSLFKTEIISHLVWHDIEKNIADRDIKHRKYFFGILLNEKSEDTTHEKVDSKGNIKGFNAK